jgi:hypothetical protein
LSLAVRLLSHFLLSQPRGRSHSIAGAGYLLGAGGHGQVVAIRALLKETVFEPQEAARLVAAYERALDQLHLKDRNDPMTDLIAKKIIEVSANCRGGPEKICAAALENLGIQVRE